MASIGPIHVRVRVSLARVEPASCIDGWHNDGLRCRAAGVVYRVSGAIARLADRLDAPERHL